MSTPPKVAVHLLSHDAEPMLPWALRHYATFASEIVVHDGGPHTFTSSRCARAYNAVPVKWDTAGQLNDELAMKLKNECWKGTDADWVICADADELLYFPAGALETLSVYEKRGAAVIKPHGFEMFSETLPDGHGQIWEECPMGAPDDEWYSKPILFSPKRVEESGFGVGAHESDPLLKMGTRVHVGRNWPRPTPPVFLLHYHQIGPSDHVAERYDAQRKRLSAVNEKNRWGNFADGKTHVAEKRSKILPHLRRVVST